MTQGTKEKKGQNNGFSTLHAKRAVQVRKHSYSPYSGFAVGAVVVTDKGKVYSGVNCETANYDSTCAEHSAIAAMVSDGGRKIRDVYVVGPAKADPTPPCGRCRQRILEFSDPKTRVHILTHHGKLYKSYTMDELLPDSFKPHRLKKKK